MLYIKKLLWLYARRHLHMSGCTSLSVCARSVCTPRVSGCRALHARAFRPVGDQGPTRGCRSPAGLTPFPRPAAGYGDWPPAASQPSPLPPCTPAPPPPARPRSPLSPAVSARPRRAALRSHWLGAPLCGGSCGPSAFECREGPGNTNTTKRCFLLYCSHVHDTGSFSEKKYWGKKLAFENLLL